MINGINAHDPVIGIFIFILGLIFGSFLNVCIYRMPREESIVKPGSHCPSCGKPVAWYDNIPLLSYLILKAKCRHCHEKISVRYFVIELVCGLMWLALWKYYGLSRILIAALIFFTILLAVIFTDFETGLIPDALSFPGMISGLLLSALAPAIHGQTVWFHGVLDSVFGLLAGGGILYLIAVIGDFIFKKETMGGGDIKLIAMMGAFLGWKKILFVFFLAPLPSLPLALFMKFFKKQDTIPYGPFLALTGAAFFLAGDKIMAWLGF